MDVLVSNPGLRVDRPNTRNQIMLHQMVLLINKPQVEQPMWRSIRDPEDLKEVEAPIHLDNLPLKMVSLSAPRNDRFNCPGNIPGTHIC